VPEEQLDMLMAMLPIPGLDPSALDPLALVSLEPEMLLELLPVFLPLLQQFSGGELPEGFSADMLRDLMSGGGLPEGAGDLLSGGAGGDDAVAELIRSALGGQLSDEELSGLLSGMGQGAGGGPGSPPQGGAGGEGRQPRDLGDLDRERDERNRQFDGRRGGGRR
jgi:hypothetical protein